jgi:hypothetical protein
MAKEFLFRIRLAKHTTKKIPALGRKGKAQSPKPALRLSHEVIGSSDAVRTSSGPFTSANDYFEFESKS